MIVNFIELAKMSLDERTHLYRRSGVDLMDLISEVTPLVDLVRKQGDQAVQTLTKRFDGVDMAPSQFRVKAEEIDKAVDEISEDLLKALQVSITNIPVSYTHLTLPTILRV